ncbi:ParM/StbA family protein [Fictibacillus sp. NRS-1165]|uniref:ParM/StbA family protein n=1 Tax=Fictibacillus sp. NRS-1165 TaxID=3144463 RepID=UPI003D1D0F80
MTFKAGADAGNNGLKLCVKDMNPLMIQSVYSLYMGEKSTELDAKDIAPEELHNNIDVTIASKSLIGDKARRYIIGEKVMTDMLDPIEMEKRSDKSTDEMPLILTLAGLAIQSIRMNKDSDLIHIKYDLSVALPIKTITPETAKENADRFMGKHDVTFHHPSGRDVKIVIDIEYCVCLPEGAAGAWGIVFDSNGNTVPRKIEVNEEIITVDFRNRSMLIFDIGSGTTEMVVMKGVRYIAKLSEGLGYGVKKTILEIIKRWNHMKSKEIDSIAEFNEIYFDSEHPRHNDLVQFAETGLYGLALQMSQAIINKIDEMKDVPHVFICGGGAAVTHNYLFQILKQKKRLSTVTFLKDPMFVNALGLLVYTVSPRFEQRKEEYFETA